jgi:hypothetical protein
MIVIARNGMTKQSPGKRRGSLRRAYALLAMTDLQDYVDGESVLYPCTITWRFAEFAGFTFDKTAWILGLAIG